MAHIYPYDQSLVSYSLVTSVLLLQRYHTKHREWSNNVMSSLTSRWLLELPIMWNAWFGTCLYRKFTRTKIIMTFNTIDTLRMIILSYSRNCHSSKVSANYYWPHLDQVHRFHIPACMGVLKSSWMHTATSQYLTKYYSSSSSSSSPAWQQLYNSIMVSQRNIFFEHLTKPN